MVRFGVVVAIVLAHGVCATASAGEATRVVHLSPAPTSIDRPSCAVAPVEPRVAGPGATTVSFTILPAACR